MQAPRIILPILLLGMCRSEGATIPAPVLQFPAENEQIISTDARTFFWTHEGRASQWYQIYIQLNGAFFFKDWLKVEDVWGYDGETSIRYELRSDLPVGEYKFWVQGYEPSLGSGAWSEPRQFEVRPAELTPPSIYFPREGMTFGPDQADFSLRLWPSFYGSSGSGEEITWSELEIYREGILYGKQWVENDYPGSLIFQSSGADEWNEALPDGDYSWRSRDYSAVGGIGPWSNRVHFSIEGLDCSSPPDPVSPFIYLDDHVSSTPNVSSDPSFSFLSSDTPAAIWNQLYVSSASSGKIILNRWIHFDSLIANAYDLAPGTYHFWTRSYNNCGIGSWSSRSSFEIQEIEGQRPTGLEVIGYSSYGQAYLLFDKQPGVTWYEIYAAAGGSVILHQWSKLLQYPATFGSAWAEGKLIAQLPPSLSTPDVWVRSHGNGPNAMGEWTQVPEVLENPFGGQPPVEISAEVFGKNVNLKWRNLAGYGITEIYLLRDGKFYAQDFTRTYVGTDGVSLDHPTIDPQESNFHYRYDLSPGQYTAYLRARPSRIWGIVDNLAGPWSPPFHFQVDDPGE